MKLVKVQFEDFKSICEGTLDIESGITTLVGINESGKSNVLFAIEKADIKKKLENYDIRRSSERAYKDSESPKLVLFFDLTEAEASSMAPLFGMKEPNFSKLVLTKEADRYGLNFPAINCESSTLAKPLKLDVDMTALNEADAQLTQVNTELAAQRKSLAEATEDLRKNELSASVQALENKLPTLLEQKKKAAEEVEAAKAAKKKEREAATRVSVIQKVLKDFMPRVLFFDSVAIENFYLPADGRVEVDKLIEFPGKFKPIVNLLALGGITDLEILRPSDNGRKTTLRKQKLHQASTQINNELLRKHWPLEDVEFHLSMEETNFLSINLREKGDDTMFVPGDRSRGLQWSVAFNIYFLSESKGELRNSILLIDEPGVFLHIDAQRKLLEETFPAILRGNNQIIYTTHLPYLIHPQFPERIRILEKQKNGGETTIGNKAWSEGKIGEIPEPVKTALGTKWTEWFGKEDNNCMVEGPSDQVILRSLTEKIGGVINFIPAYGKDTIPSALALSKLDTKNSIGIIDNDLKEDEREALDERLALVNIDKATLVDISDLTEVDEVATIEDIVPENVYRDAVHKVYKHAITQLDKDYKAEDIPTEYPRVPNFVKFYQKKSEQGGHAFKKMEVARTVADIVSSIDAPAPNNPKWTAVRKILKNIEITMSKKLLLQKVEKPATKEAGAR